MAKPRELQPEFVDDARETPTRTYEVHDIASPDMVEAVFTHKSLLPRMGQGTPAQKAAGRAEHRAWLLEMDRRFPTVGWGEEVAAWDRYVARRYGGRTSEPAPAWVTEDTR